MSNQYFDRYQYFLEDGSFKIVPGIEIPIKGSDKYFQYKKGKHGKYMGDKFIITSSPWSPKEIIFL